MRRMRQRWVYTRWFALIAGLMIGAVVGLAVYWASTLTGVALYTLCGTVAGGLAALAIYTFWRSVHLTELTVSIPNMTDLTFAVTPSNEGVAWRLFVESSTRVATQPLDQGSGVIRETLDSLYSLFGSVRAILLEAGPTTTPGATQTVEHLALGMLNGQLRPFLSRWHPRLTTWEQSNPDTPESQWPENAACRAELETMRTGLLRYVRGLGELAGVGNIDVMLGRPDTKDSA
ncbi:hypothetical protein CLV67_105355 [Actinoplanes italicus]|uniref:Uncharacterized protein n=2 Tax=Actinoplanes italicus TaxID=113567 RepID=A0A2T0KG86_9ACTN|nr:hypothetical protein CLV67_105355 [Actinoplanes italicus]